MQRRDGYGGRRAICPVSSLHTRQRSDRGGANLLHRKQRRRDPPDEACVVTATSTGRYPAVD
jgi:hypothetical protein